MLPNTERVTRARARTMAAEGQTPALEALANKAPATGRTTRRRAAAAAASAQEVEGDVAPVVLFDVTTEQACGAQQPPTTPRDAHEQQQQQAEAAAPDASPAPARHDRPAPASQQQDEPPATPASAPASPAPALPGATPTGLGLSNLLPLSPMLAFQLQATTPAATPLGGVQSNHSQVEDALAAAVQALGCGGATEQLVFKGFGSPLRQEGAAESPALLAPGAAAASPAAPASVGPSVSIGAAIGAAGSAGDEAPSRPSPMGVEVEREVTLEDMMGTPPGAERQDAAPAPAPAFAAAVGPRVMGTPVAVASGTPAAVVRTVAEAHPLTPARQVVLEEEEQDYIMEVAGEPTPSPSPAPAAPAAPAAAAADPAARIASKVVVPSPGVYDPRSLRQLKKEVADRLAAKQAAAPAAYPGFEGEEDECGDGEYISATGGEALADALGALSLQGGTHGQLKGLPTPQGVHVRFGDDGDVEAVSPRQRVYLRGMPQPAGQHLHFADDE